MQYQAVKQVKQTKAGPWEDCFLTCAFTLLETLLNSPKSAVTFTHLEKLGGTAFQVVGGSNLFLWPRKPASCFYESDSGQYVMQVAQETP